MATQRSVVIVGFHSPAQLALLVHLVGHALRATRRTILVGKRTSRRDRGLDVPRSDVQPACDAISYDEVLV